MPDQPLEYLPIESGKVMIAEPMPNTPDHHSFRFEAIEDPIMTRMEGPLGRGLTYPTMFLDDSTPTSLMTPQRLKETFMISAIRVDDKRESVGGRDNNKAWIFRKTFKLNEDVDLSTYDAIEATGLFDYPSRKVRNQAIRSLTIFLRRIWITTQYIYCDRTINGKEGFQFFIDLLARPGVLKKPEKAAQIAAALTPIIPAADEDLRNRLLDYAYRYVQSDESISTSQLYLTHVVLTHSTPETDQYRPQAFLKILSTRGKALKRLRDEIDRKRKFLDGRVINFIGNLEDNHPLVHFIDPIHLDRIGMTLHEIQGLDFIYYGTKYGNCLGNNRIYKARAKGEVYFKVRDRRKNVIGFLQMSLKNTSDLSSGYTSKDEWIPTFWDLENKASTDALSNTLFGEIGELLTTIDPHHDPKLLVETAKQIERTRAYFQSTYENMETWQVTCNPCYVAANFAG